MSNVNINELNVAETADASEFAVIASVRAVELMREILRGRTYADWQEDVAVNGMTPRDGDRAATAGTELLLGLASVVAGHDSDHSIATE